MVKKTFSDESRRAYANIMPQYGKRVSLADATDENMLNAGMIPTVSVEESMPVEEAVSEEVMAPVGEIAELKKKFEDALKNEELDKDLKKQAEEMLAKIEELEKAMEDAKALVEKISPPAPPVEEAAVAEVPAEVPSV
jgi:archaellum component FlaC